MNSDHTVESQLSALAAHLKARREAILRAWRKAIDRDPEMNTGASLPRAQLDDHIPALLDAFGRRLPLSLNGGYRGQRRRQRRRHRARSASAGSKATTFAKSRANGGRLQLCMAEELESYASAHPEVDPRVMSIARRVWSELCTDGASESVAKYFQLQQIEAKGHVRDLAQALEQLREMERSRAELWRQAAHDLRGSVGVVMNVTAGLGYARPGAAFTRQIPSHAAEERLVVVFAARECDGPGAPAGGTRTSRGESLRCGGNSAGAL
jgi:hypothetical protein